MNSRHLKTGDDCPPFVKGKVRIFNMRFCPYAHRALLVCAAKKIPYDVVNVDLIEKPQFIFSRNPKGQVPTLELSNGTSLYESLIVCDYLDEAFLDVASAGDSNQSRRLICKDPYIKAVDRILISGFDTFTSLDHKLAMIPPAETEVGYVISLLEQLFEALEPFEEELAKRQRTFFAGDDYPGMLDYMIWPWFERLPVQEMVWGSKFDFKAARKEIPLLTAWEDNMTKDAAVMELFISPKYHYQYRQARRLGVAQQAYDILVDA